MSFSFLFFLFFFLTRIVAGQWWPQPRRRPLMCTQALTALTPSPQRPTPALVTSLTPPQPPLPGLSQPQQLQPDPPPHENIQISFFVFSFSSQPDRTMAATSLPSSPPPSPACRQSRSRAHTAETAARRCNDLVAAPTMAASAAATSIVVTPTATAATPVTVPRPSLPQLPPPPRFRPRRRTNCPPAPCIT